MGQVHGRCRIRVRTTPLLPIREGVDRLAATISCMSHPDIAGVAALLKLLDRGVLRVWTKRSSAHL